MPPPYSLANYMCLHPDSSKHTCCKWPNSMTIYNTYPLSSTSLLPKLDSDYTTCPNPNSNPPPTMLLTSDSDYTRCPTPRPPSPPSWGSVDKELGRSHPRGGWWPADHCLGSRTLRLPGNTKQYLVSKSEKHLYIKLSLKKKIQL